MRILHVHKYYHARDGVGRYMFDLMRLSEAAGHTTAALAMHDPRNLPSAWDEYFVSEMDTSSAKIGVRAFRQLSRAWWSREAERKMTSMLEAFRPDVVHVHNIYTQFSPSVLKPCHQRGIPVVMTVHDFSLVSANYVLWTGEQVIDVDHADLLSVAKSKFIKGSFLATLVLDSVVRLQKKLGLFDRAIDRYITLSEFMRDTLVFAGYNQEKIAVVPPAAGPLLLKKVFDEPRDFKAVLFAGRLENYKGIENYLALAEKFPEHTFFVAGTGPLEGEVRRMMHAHGNIVYLGFLSSEELWRKMASVGTVIVPSLWYEPFGLVALEAMALGTPVLISDRGGLPELVRASKGGKIFKAGNINDLAKRFSEMQAMTEWTRMSGNARTYVAEHNEPQVFFTRMMKEYEDIIR